MRKEDFDVSNPVVVVRLLCGLFYGPHILFKLGNMAGSAAFFGKVLPFPELFLYLAIAAELACFFGLTLNIMTKWLGLLSAGVMAVAVYATVMTKGMGWFWNLGGIEYLAFWGIASASLAVQAWKQEQATYGRLSFLLPTTPRLA
ncbi:DoxX family protein [Falsiroseomonas sp.]|uniref:DoxX family protein n=1 Tax=Falsiroseomonas sp. TaxID=2870721 RepID=UPI003F6F9E68